MIRSAIFHKLLGISSAIIAVLGIASILSPQEAEYYFTLAAVGQLSIPFVAFGLTQSLIRRALSSNAIELNIHEFILFPLFLITFVIISFVISNKYSDNNFYVFYYFVFTLVVLSVSEFIRVSYSNHFGFTVINLSVFFLVLILCINNTFTPVTLLVPVMSIFIILIYSYFKKFRVVISSKIKTIITIDDILKSIRVTVYNQYYNLLIVMLSILGNFTDGLISIIVYRLNVILNWQVFYWLRFGHRASVDGITEKAKDDNRKVAIINILSIAMVNGSFVLGYYFSLFEFFKIDIITKELIALVILFSIFKILLSVFFPYELFTIYTVHSRVGNKVAMITASCLVFLSISTYAFNSLVYVLIGAELILLFTRVVAKKELSENV